MKNMIIKVALMACLGLIPFGTIGYAQKAKAFLNKLEGAVQVTAENNKIGLFIESVTKSGEDYIVNWNCTNKLIRDNSGNMLLLMSEIYFIDPENYKNNYQPFSVGKDGKLDMKYEKGDPIGPVKRVKFSPPSKVMYMYFTGIEKGNGNPPELYTAPLFSL